MHYWNWLDIAFPWIGVVGAVILLVLLFGTNVLRGVTGSSRWRDITWLSWLAVAVYLVHNVEEYGIDLLGERHAFPAALCTTLGLPAYPQCPIPPAFFLAVNIPMFWIAGPIAALLSRRRPFVGFALYGVIFINGLSHVLSTVMSGSYNAGLFTAVVLFLPLSAWVAYACFGKNGLSYKLLVALIASGVIAHVILIGSLLLHIHGYIGDTTLVVVQLINAGLLIGYAWLGERWRRTHEPSAVGELG